MHIKDVRSIYLSRKDEIEKRLKDFSQLWAKKTDKDIFTELAFCLLTPQSKAKVCWNAISSLLKEDRLLCSKRPQILCRLIGVRFKNKKSGYICQARNFFSDNGSIKIRPKLKEFSDSRRMRDWLVENIKGLGYKEASHFLRNIGIGLDLAILDRHILKNLRLLGVIDEIPTSLTRRRYLEIEDKMIKFSKKINIPIACLDLVLWCRETGEVFK